MWSQYCGEPSWPRGSVLGLRPPGLEFQVLCLEDSTSHLNHLTSLRRFCWPSLAYICTKMSKSPILFICVMDLTPIWFLSRNTPCSINAWPPRLRPWSSIKPTSLADVTLLCVLNCLSVALSSSPASDYFQLGRHTSYRLWSCEWGEWLIDRLKRSWVKTRVSTI